MRKIILSNLSFVFMVIAAWFANDLILGIVFIGLFAGCAFLATRQKEIDHSAGKQGWSI